MQGLRPATPPEYTKVQCIVLVSRYSLRSKTKITLTTKTISPSLTNVNS